MTVVTEVKAAVRAVAQAAALALAGVAFSQAHAQLTPTASPAWVMVMAVTMSAPPAARAPCPYTAM